MPGWFSRLFGGGEPSRPFVKDFHTSLAGVSHKNADRTSRQKIIREEVHSGMGLICRPEPTNKFDPNAVAVFASSGRQIGYLDSQLAAETQQWIKEGMTVTVTVTEVTGGTKDKPNLGVNVWVQAR